ncbi:reverse transcriptase domain-containing protein [Tanacetum coccineum]|uniref:Reverse transcriptase domain-containing protein n=1 Tax=Tanacetum coccineum TaxID=301880 RepID=A0ABQ5BX28_9ASTR
MEFTYALRFRLNATNNEAEYEALIAGLRITRQIGVQNLQANVDSKLVANQVHRPMPRNPREKLTPITSPWPFYKWGIDIAGPFPEGPGKSSNGETPFSLTYGAEAVIPVEIGMPTLRTAEVDMIKNNEDLEINLDLLKEKREQTAIQEARSKAKMEKYYNTRVRNTSFRPGDFVYRNNDSSHAKDGGKLGPKWEGPYEFTEALGRGAYKLKDRDGK